LAAALNTRFYKRVLEAGPITAARPLADCGQTEDLLSSLPRTELDFLRIDPKAFRNPEARKVKPNALFHPLPQAGRTAVLMPGFKSAPGVKVFQEGSRQHLSRYRPDSIAGPVGALRRLAEGHEDRRAWVPRLTHSVVAFTIPRQGFLSEEARELLWRVFRVPVFCQFLGLDAELLAWECEAHEGLHIERDHAVFESDCRSGEPELLVTSLVNLRWPVLRLATGLTAEIECSTCGCGLTGPRLMGLRRRSLESRMAIGGVAVSSSCAAD
jgi:hypothetical protein